MELPFNLLPLICILPLSPVTWICLGWIIFSIMVGIRVEIEAGIRLFLLGLGLLLAAVIMGVILFYLPDWIAAIIVSFGAILPWILLLRYLIASRFSGKLLMALPLKNENLSISIMSGVFLMLLGSSRLISHNDFLTPTKSYVLGVTLISLGIFRMVQRIRFTQLREKGILSEIGKLYKWENIENYVWKFGEDKLSIKLKKAVFKKNVNLKIPSQFRQEVVAYLSQKAKLEKINTRSCIPTQIPS